MKDHPEMNAYMADYDAWMQDYIKTPKVTVTLPSGKVLTYHESSPELQERHEVMAAQLRRIQADTRAEYPHLFTHA